MRSNVYVPLPVRKTHFKLLSPLCAFSSRAGPAPDRSRPEIPNVGNHGPYQPSFWAATREAYRHLVEALRFLADCLSNLSDQFCVICCLLCLQRYHNSSMSPIAARSLVYALALVCCLAVFSNYSLATAFECGAPQAPCGIDIPAGTTCPNGAGWCTAGHYCGHVEQVRPENGSRCLPLPENCGTAGYQCCPSNAETPHTSTTNNSDKQPFCKDGSICAYYDFYLSPRFTPDIYAGVPGERNLGLSACQSDGQAT
jgi:hypothetical protein